MLRMRAGSAKLPSIEGEKGSVRLRKLRPQKRDNSASERGQQAVAAILTAARDVLVEEGYPRLTMRNVAERADMTVGNLSYYYANKEDLLHDLLEAVIQGYVEDFDQIATNAARSPEERLEEMIRFVIGDLSTKETTGFFPALWALANHDDFAAREMSNVYQVERDAFARVIAILRTDLGKKERDLLALFISASIEGHTMFIGYKREKSGAGEAIANIAAHSFLALVKGIDASTIRGLKVAPKPGAKRLAS
jgi:AcrR family transcriptional regulator